MNRLNCLSDLFGRPLTRRGKADIPRARRGRFGGQQFFADSTEQNKSKPTPEETKCRRAALVRHPPGPATFESCKTSSRAPVSFFPKRTSLLPVDPGPHARDARGLEPQRLRNPTLRDKVPRREKFLGPACSAANLKLGVSARASGPDSG